MTAIEIEKGVFWTGVNVRTDDQFEGMWPLPNGVSLNSYVVKGEKTAIIDLVREWRGSSFDFHRQLASIGIKPTDIDIIVLNHLEPDHTEVLRVLVNSVPNVKIITTEKGAELVEEFYGISENIQKVKSGDQLDLGGKTLHFVEVPYVHWPETMVTYLSEDKILFSCDAFGSFGCLDGIIFDDELTPQRKVFFQKETLRYYANIVAVYSKMVLKAIDKLKDVEIDIIAPSHGLIWRSNPEDIISQYITLAKYKDGIGLKPKITLVFGSMYGNTEAMTNAILRGFAKVKGVNVEVFEVPNPNNGSFILASAWESGGLVIGAPTYEGKLFPPMVNTLDLLHRKGVAHKSVFRYGSYGWSGGAQREFERLTKDLDFEFHEPLEFRAGPSLKELKRGEERGEEFAQHIKEKYG